jgi:hypothetical protein
MFCARDRFAVYDICVRAEISPRFGYSWCHRGTEIEADAVVRVLNGV